MADLAHRMQKHPKQNQAANAAPSALKHLLDNSLQQSNREGASAGPAAATGVARRPMQYCSSCFLALAEWMASNSSVASVPATSRMLSAPPGCSFRNGVASYTWCHMAGLIRLMGHCIVIAIDPSSSDWRRPHLAAANSLLKLGQQRP